MWFSTVPSDHFSTLPTGAAPPTKLQTPLGFTHKCIDEISSEHLQEPPLFKGHFKSLFMTFLSSGTRLVASAISAQAWPCLSELFWWCPSETGQEGWGPFPGIWDSAGIWDVVLWPTGSLDSSSPWLASMQHRVVSDIRDKKHCDLAMFCELLGFIDRSSAPSVAVLEGWDL